MQNGQSMSAEAIGFDRLETADGMFVVDPGQRIVSWNQAAEELIGYPAEDIVGQRCHEVMCGRETAPRPYCRRNCPVIMNARRGRPTRDYDLLCQTANGERKWLNFTILVPRGAVARGHAIHVFRDVTRQRRVAAFAKRAVAALRAFDEGAEETWEDGAAMPAPLPALSRREDQVLRLLAAGLSTREIAEALEVRPLTARNHVTRLLNKLGATNRIGAVIYASERGLL